MADPTQDAHTRKVKDLMPAGGPAGFGIEDYAEPEKLSEMICTVGGKVPLDGCRN